MTLPHNNNINTNTIQLQTTTTPSSSTLSSLSKQQKHQRHHSNNNTRCQPTIFCFTYTSTMESAHATKICAIRERWAPGCDGYLAFSTKNVNLIKMSALLVVLGSGK